MIFGPAIIPSFVTWPIKKIAEPAFFALTDSSIQHVLIWLGEPAADSRVEEDRVWTESTTMYAGLILSITSSMDSSLVSQKIWIFSVGRFSLSALSLTCDGLSSPEI